WVVIGSWFAVMCTQTLSLQGIVQISLSAKDAKTARNGFIIGGLLMLPVGFLAAVMGIAAKGMYPDMSATLALPQMIMSLSPVLAGITLAALWAADVSTAGSLLLGSATLFSQDIYKRFMKPEADGKHLMLVTRLSVLILGILTFILALTISGILKTIMIGLSLTTAFSVVFLFTVFAPGLARKNSAFYTTLVGIIGIVAWQFIPALQIFPHVIYLEWILCVATFLLVPLFDKQPIKSPAEVPVG
ncbi:MAG: sodium:solute symporter family protein, partial [Desulfitobacterium sp.]|nr:sodium:solute symporter family protein [Desulfitobacterium sp.]